MQTIFSHLYCVAFLDYLLTKWNLTPGPSTQVFQPGTRFLKWAVLKIASANDEDDVIVCVCVCVCLCVCVSLRLLEASSLCVCVFVCLCVWVSLRLPEVLAFVSSTSGSMCQSSDQS